MPAEIILSTLSGGDRCTPFLGGGERGGFGLCSTKNAVTFLVVVVGFDWGRGGGGLFLSFLGKSPFQPPPGLYPPKKGKKGKGRKDRGFFLGFFKREESISNQTQPNPTPYTRRT